ncbi:hypothetical protein JAAARDRAFT_406369 [Jaapia argillacea MUCL 33604]|uniref:C2H2-type domain-containing protein n=1 Tax=Jaapia argillacea MUCL 33604 TaxID=933084 RepID=A0A067PVL8_9AGAM|nr:hypothetical protein JAAARDRAFT_406369 [Jaapia argillacea MUCL 33604]
MTSSPSSNAGRGHRRTGSRGSSPYPPHHGSSLHGTPPHGAGSQISLGDQPSLYRGRSSSFNSSLHGSSFRDSPHPNPSSPYHDSNHDHPPPSPSPSATSHYSPSPTSPISGHSFSTNHLGEGSSQGPSYSTGLVLSPPNNIGSCAGSAAAAAASEKRRKKPHKWFCDLCKKGFTRKETLQNHYNSLTKEKEYPCGKCGKTFGRKNDRKRHMDSCTR